MLQKLSKIGGASIPNFPFYFVDKVSQVNSKLSYSGVIGLKNKMFIYVPAYEDSKMVRNIYYLPKNYETLTEKSLLMGDYPENIKKDTNEEHFLLFTALNYNNIKGITSDNIEEGYELNISLSSSSSSSKSVLNNASVWFFRNKYFKDFSKCQTVNNKNEYYLYFECDKSVDLKKLPKIGLILNSNNNTYYLSPENIFTTDEQTGNQRLNILFRRESDEVSSSYLSVSLRDLANYERLVDSNYHEFSVYDSQVQKFDKELEKLPEGKNPDDEDGGLGAGWIVLIVFGCIIVVGAPIGYYFYRRRQISTYSLLTSN